MNKLTPDLPRFTTSKPWLRQFGENGQPLLQAGGRYIVKSDDEGHWDLVKPRDEVIATEELAESYGFWRDREIKKDGFFRDTVVRPLNNTIESDEVVPFSKAFGKAHDFPTSNYTTLENSFNRAVPLHSDLVMTRDGATLNTRWETVSSFEAWGGQRSNILAGDYNHSRSLSDIRSDNYDVR